MDLQLSELRRRAKSPQASLEDTVKYFAALMRTGAVPSGYWEALRLVNGCSDLSFNLTGAPRNDTTYSMAVLHINVGRAFLAGNVPDQDVYDYTILLLNLLLHEWSLSIYLDYQIDMQTAVDYLSTLTVDADIDDESKMDSIQSLIAEMVNSANFADGRMGPWVGCASIVEFFVTMICLRFLHQSELSPITIADWLQDSNYMNVDPDTQGDPIETYLETGAESSCSILLEPMTWTWRAFLVTQVVQHLMFDRIALAYTILPMSGLEDERYRAGLLNNKTQEQFPRICSAIERFLIDRIMKYGDTC